MLGFGFFSLGSLASDLRLRICSLGSLARGEAFGDIDPKKGE
jgi:hypothetical protein